MNGKENAECSSASAQRASQTRESIKEEKDVRGIHLMLAEDNELNAEIVKALLEKRGITVDVAQDGRKALKMFKSHGSGTYSLTRGCPNHTHRRHDSQRFGRGRAEMPCGGYEYAFVQTDSNRRTGCLDCKALPKKIAG